MFISHTTFKDNKFIGKIVDWEVTQCDRWQLNFNHRLVVDTRVQQKQANVSLRSENDI